MPVLDAAGRQIGYHEAGAEDAPLVIFAHCSLGHGGLWKGVMNALSDEWRCIATDLPGHGRSGRGDVSISLQDQAAKDVAVIAERFGDRRAHLVGLSLGGAIMGRAAIRIPGLARSLALLEPIYMHLLTRDRPDMEAENRASMAGCYEACGEGRWRDGAKAFMESWGQPGQFDKFPEPAKAAVGEAMKWIYRDFPMAHSYIAGQVTHDDLATIRVPTTLIHGERTQDSAKAVIAEVAGVIPHAERAEITGAGHLSPVDDPGQVAEVLRRFLRAAETGRA